MRPQGIEEELKLSTARQQAVEEELKGAQQALRESEAKRAIQKEAEERRVKEAERLRNHYADAIQKAKFWEAHSKKGKFSVLAPPSRVSNQSAPQTPRLSNFINIMCMRQ